MITSVVTAILTAILWFGVLASGAYRTAAMIAVLLGVSAIAWSWAVLPVSPVLAVPGAWLTFVVAVRSGRIPPKSDLRG
jgi:hypothetical protein